LTTLPRHLIVPVVSDCVMLSDIWHDHEKLRYVIVGIWNTAFAYIAFGVIYVCFHDRVHYLVVSATTHFLGVTNAFICQRWLVFRAKTHWLGAYVRFNIVNLVILGFSLTSIAILVEFLHRSPLVSQVTVMMASIVVGYLLNRKFSFGYAARKSV
jgi:putative flippase GtrA